MGESATKKKKKEDPAVVVTAPRRRFSAEHSADAKEAKRVRLKRFFHVLPMRVHRGFHNFVLSYFKTVNRKAGKSMKFLAMKMETFEHVDSVFKVFKWLILPVTFIYVIGAVLLLGENTLDAALLGILLFFYSNFLPDLPAVFRKKYYPDVAALNTSLPWYKNYALLLFAPVFLGLFLCGVRWKWGTLETFHNFKSLLVYVAFLGVIGFLVFTSFPIGLGEVTESLSVPLYGLAGYLTHLRVDLCF